jgi:imidazolonepropionase-like amidohydrolase
MEEQLNTNQTRREFLKKSALLAGAIVLPEFSTGCASLSHIDRLSIDYDRDIILNNCSLVDPKNSTIRTGASLRISHGKVASVANRIDSASQSFDVFELDGRFVIPGLINAHCHSTMTGTASFNPMNFLSYLRQMKRNFVLSIQSGETTIRDMGALPTVLHDHLEEIESGSLIGPRVVFCNAIMNIDGGHPDIRPSDISIFGNTTTLFTGNITANFRNTPELREKLRENAEHGASFIKLTVDNRSLICGRGEIPMYSREHLREIFNFAERRNLPVCCHNHMKYGFDRIMEYPIHSLEHIIFDEYLSDEDIERMSRKNVSIVPTFIVAQCLAFNEVFDAIPDEYNTDFIRNEMRIKYEYLRTIASQYCEEAIHADNMRHLNLYRSMNCRDLTANKIFLPNPILYFGMMKYGLANLLKMRQAGITIGCGTDAGVPYDYFGTLWREMEMLHRAGFTKQEVLRYATVNGAKILGMEGRIGVLEPGAFADAVVLRDNPFERIEAYREPSLVFKGGKLLHARANLSRERNVLRFS